MTQAPLHLPSQLSFEQIAKEAKLLDEYLDLQNQLYLKHAELADCWGQQVEARKWRQAAAKAQTERREAAAKAAEYTKEAA